MNARWVVAVVAAAFWFSPQALGNGKYLSEVAHPLDPAIPLQRALISYKDGVETLVIESSYLSDSANVGWILPLPAEPTKLDKADAALLKSVSTSLRPAITHDLTRPVDRAYASNLSLGDR